MNSTASPVSTSARFLNYWLPVLIMLTIQYVFSTNSFSSEETSRFIVPVLRAVFRGISWDQLELWHHVIRKAAHITEYCILGILVYRAIHVDLSYPAAVRMLTVVFVAVTAATDEFHQSFVSSRTSSVFDVGFDCIGGMVALLLLWLWRTSRVAEE